MALQSSPNKLGNCVATTFQSIVFTVLTVKMLVVIINLPSTVHIISNSQYTQKTRI